MKKFIAMLLDNFSYIMAGKTVAEKFSRLWGFSSNAFVWTLLIVYMKVMGKKDER